MSNNILDFEKHYENKLVERMSKKFTLPKNIVFEALDNFKSGGLSVYKDQDILDGYLAMRLLVERFKN